MRTANRVRVPESNESSTAKKPNTPAPAIMAIDNTPIKRVIKRLRFSRSWGR